MPAALDVDREAVKTLAMAIGVREAARKMGLPESTVKSWSDRGDWLRPIVQPPTVIRASGASKTPSEALVQALSDDALHTRIGFSQAARKVATHLGEKEPGALIERDTAQSARNWTDVASKVHGWEAEKREGDKVMINVAILGQ